MLRLSKRNENGRNFNPSPGFSSGVMGAMTLVGNVTGAGIGFFFPVSTNIKHVISRLA